MEDGAVVDDQIGAGPPAEPIVKQARPGASPGDGTGR